MPYHRLYRHVHNILAHMICPFNGQFMPLLL